MTKQRWKSAREDPRLNELAAYYYYNVEIVQ